MMDDNFNFPFDDPFDSQQSVTPSLDALQTKGTAKLLVVIFIVDCSMTMKGDRIGAVNAALQELKFKLQEIKDDNGLDMRVAVMSFTSSAKWDLQLTPVEEVVLDTIRVRPGLTEYGAAFHELNKVLRRDQFMQHTGKIAPPAIMFLTDGEPTDDYQYDLDELLKNGWFINASRSAVLLGDAISNASAREAVRQFVEDPETEIVAAEDSTVIMQKLKIATLHTVAGVPIVDGGNAPAAGTDDPFGQTASQGADAPSGGQASQSGKDDPFGDPAPQGGNADPFSAPTPQGGNVDPFGGQTSQGGNGDPFGDPVPQGGDSDPFGGPALQGGDGDPFDGQAASGGDCDPFGGQTASGGGDDPFGGRTLSGGADDPFGGQAASGDPDDPVGPSDPDGDDAVFDLDSVFDGPDTGDDPF